MVFLDQKAVTELFPPTPQHQQTKQQQTDGRFPFRRLRRQDVVLLPFHRAEAHAEDHAAGHLPAEEPQLAAGHGEEGGLPGELPGSWSFWHRGKVLVLNKMKVFNLNLLRYLSLLLIYVFVEYRFCFGRLEQMASFGLVVTIGT